MSALPHRLAATLAFVSVAALAAPQFPALTGRVVDEAGILSPQIESEIGAQLAAHEQATTNQVVVATLKSLQAYDISDYANQLFRHWGIGQKDKNNGVLLVVAPNERKVRIEIGYGLEGVLTDALSRDIIERVITPPFRQGDYEQGIRSGATAILAALGGDYRPAPPPSTAARVGEVVFGSLIADLVGGGVFGLLIAALIGGQFLLGALTRRASMGARFVTAAGLGAAAGVVAWFVAGLVMIGIVIGAVVFLFMLLSTGRVGSGGSGGGWGGSGGGWSGGGGGGGFSGGGGSSGGGGASGSW